MIISIVVILIIYCLSCFGSYKYFKKFGGDIFLTFFPLINMCVAITFIFEDWKCIKNSAVKLFKTKIKKNNMSTTLDEAEKYRETADLQIVTFGIVGSNWEKYYNYNLLCKNCTYNNSLFILKGYEIKNVKLPPCKKCGCRNY